MFRAAARCRMQTTMSELVREQERPLGIVPSVLAENCPALIIVERLCSFETRVSGIEPFQSKILTLDCGCYELERPQRIVALSDEFVVQQPSIDPDRLEWIHRLKGQ